MIMYSELKSNDGKHVYRFKRKVKLVPVYDEHTTRYCIEFRELGLRAEDTKLDKVMPRLIGKIDTLWHNYIEIDTGIHSRFAKDIADRLRSVMTKEENT